MTVPTQDDSDLDWPEDSKAAPDDGGGTKGQGWLPPALSVGIRAVIPILVAGTFIALLIGESSVVEKIDLQIICPNAQTPDNPIPIRASVFAMGTEVLVEDVAVSVSILDADRKTRQKISLVSHGKLGLDGHLDALPKGMYQIRAEIKQPAPTVVEKQIRITEDAPVAEKKGYLSQPWQKYDVQKVTGADFRPEHLNVRVPRGVCSPETNCALSIFVGTPTVPAKVQIVVPENKTLSVVDCVPFENASYTNPDGANLCAIGNPTNGFLSPEVLIQGSQATFTVLAFVDGKKVASRKIQLPISLGTPSLRIDKTNVAVGKPVTVSVERVLDDGSPFILDMFREGHWVSTRSADNPASVRFSSAGLWRVQVRTDAYGGSETSRFVVVGQPDPLVFVSKHPVQKRWKDPVVAQGLVSAIDASEQSAATEFLLARGEAAMPVMPRAFSSRAQNLPASTQKIQGWRLSVAIFMMACGLFVGLALAFVGWRSNRQAGQVMLEAGSVPERQWLSLFLIVSAVIFAFLLVGAMVLSRGAI